MNPNPPGTVWFCNRWAGFQGGAEQHIYDVALGLRDQGIQCELVYDSLGQHSETFLSAFARTHPMNVSDPKGWPSLTPQCPTHVYYHNWPLQHLHPTLPSSVQTWYMVHDSSLFCPRSHMYHGWGGTTCTRPLTSDCLWKCKWLSHPLRWTSPQTLRKRLLHLHSVDRVVCGSSYLADLLRDLGVPAQKLWTVPLARPLPSLPEASLPDSTPTPEILFVGSCLRSKGIDLLLQSLTHITSPFVCRIVGQGKQREMFQRMAERLGFGRGDRQEQVVAFEGWKNQSELALLYQKAEVLVVPSRTPETFGLVGLEAMSHALPVVAFDVGGISEWLQHERTGFLVPAQRVDVMGRRISQLLCDRNLAQMMGRNGFASLQKNFTFSAYIQKLSKAIVETRQG